MSRSLINNTKVMLNRIIIISFFWFCQTILFGQQDVNIMSNFDKYQANQSTSLSGGRWEFFMSEIAARGTYKIDKFTGKVYILVESKDKSLTWEIIEKEINSGDTQKQSCINYQLFSSGLAMRHTFLINTNSGLTWQLVTGKNEVLYFQLIE